MEELFSPQNPKFLKTLIENIPYPTFILDKDLKFRFISSSFEYHTGYKKDELLNTFYGNLLNKEDFEIADREIRDIFESKKSKVVQIRIKIKGDKYFYVRVYLTPYKVEEEIIGVIGIGRDITGRIKAAEKLEETEKKLEELFENIPIGLYRTTPKGEVIFANKKMLEMLGFASFEELLKFDLEKNGYHPDTPREIFKKLIEEKGEIKNYEAKWRKKDGTVIYIRENAKAIKDENGKIIYYEGTVEDITKEKEIEEKLLQGTREIQTIFSMIPDLFFKISKNGTILDYFAGSKEDLYLKPTEFLGKNLSVLFKEPLNEVFLRQINNSLEKGKMEIIEYELEIGGEEKFFELRVIPFTKDQVIGIIRNITSRKLWEKTLKESEARFRAIAENAIVGVYIREDKFIYANPAFCKIFGYSQEEMIQKITPKDLTYEEDLKNISISISDRLKDQKPEKVEFFRGKRKDGEIIYLECYSILIDYLGKKMVLGILLDITDKKKAEESSIQYTNKLKKLLDGIILAMAKIVEIKDPYTSGHQQRVAELAVKIAKEYGLEKDKIEAIKVASMIHDIGKIHIPAEILTKPGELSPLEREMIQTHPVFGYEILRNIEFPWPIAQIVLQHHEKINGSGYPLHLKGDQIMVEAKIIAVADVIEAMSTHRPYRAGYGLARALDEIISYCGVWYDEKIVQICLNLFKEKDFEFTNTV